VAFLFEKSEPENGRNDERDATLIAAS